MSRRAVLLAVVLVVSLVGTFVLVRTPSTPDRGQPPAPIAVAPAVTPAAERAADAALPPFEAAVDAPPPATAPTTLPQGVVGIWAGQLDRPLKDIAPAADTTFDPTTRVTLVVGQRERITARLTRFNVTGADAGVFIGAAEGHADSTVVLSYVGAAQAGVIYLPSELRSLVINGGDDGQIRVTVTDLTKAPGCAPETPRGAPAPSSSHPHSHEPPPPPRA